MNTDTGFRNLDSWITRTRSMIDYMREARDFVRRAGEQLPTLESDFVAVCHLWALSDEQDEKICLALTQFDLELFGTAGSLDITRGAEVVTGPGGEETVSYICSWEIRRPDGRWVSVVSSTDQASRVVATEVRDSSGGVRPLGFSEQDSSRLYEALSGAFFQIAGDA